MELNELLTDNWFNLFIIFVLSLIAFIFSKRRTINYFDNLIKYTDILEKAPQPKYQKDYLNNIKRKLLWEKVCFFDVGNINKERIAISLVNADINNIIELTQLNLLTQYFSIKNNKINPINPLLIKEIILILVASFFGVFVIISNLFTIFGSHKIVNVIIAILAIFIIMIILAQFASGPFKRLNIYRLILKDRSFLTRANNVLSEMLPKSNQTVTINLDKLKVKGEENKEKDNKQEQDPKQEHEQEQEQEQEQDNQ
ncbi:hypothetical protein [Gilliamella sp. ESL0405]|uniref:hypothetical protein n=1 Tax=Gilliamella sp. ESL0405 TaxID=2704653 RepID=UPI001C6A0944|nr:hypothetical protein [Gilliamella sp. ESL0405]QYN46646.1 hypothetical protein GYM74_05300 [Gilliamella sp. ESL0405]